MRVCSGLFLMESKCSIVRSLSIAKRLGFPNAEILESRGFAGGLSFFCKDDLNIEVK